MKPLHELLKLREQLQSFGFCLHRTSHSADCEQLVTARARLLELMAIRQPAGPSAATDSLSRAVPCRAVQTRRVISSPSGIQPPPAGKKVHGVGLAPTPGRAGGRGGRKGGGRGGVGREGGRTRPGSRAPPPCSAAPLTSLRSPLSGGRAVCTRGLRRARGQRQPRPTRPGREKSVGCSIAVRAAEGAPRGGSEEDAGVPPRSEAHCEAGRAGRGVGRGAWGRAAVVEATQPVGRVGLSRGSQGGREV